jgi:hypothetical protein
LIAELELVENVLDVRREAVEVGLEIGLERLLAGADQIKSRTFFLSDKKKGQVIIRASLAVTGGAPQWRSPFIGLGFQQETRKQNFKRI